MPNLKGFDLTKGTVPLVVAFGLFLSVGAACIKIGETIAQYKQRETEVIAVAREVAALQRTIAALQLSDMWRRSDQVLFCWEAERINSSWRCPAIKPASQLGEVPQELRNQ